MAFYPQHSERKSPRLKDYDYAQAGAYFVTICTYGREYVFGEVVDGVMQLNAFGDIAQNCWDDLPQHYPHIELDLFVVMPNHVHGIVVLHSDVVGEGFKPSLDIGLSEVIRGFKTFSARRINAMRDTSGIPVWQRSFHDHIIRNERELDTLRRYIDQNPQRWTADRYFE